VLSEVREEPGEQTMRWKYYVPQTCDSPKNRTTWEDVYLMLEDAAAVRDSLWLSIDQLMQAPKMG
jgi:hypothetical protein